MMQLSYDPDKNAVNIAKHGVSFEEIREIDGESVITSPDQRREYGEVRFVTYAMLNRRLYCLIWTPRNNAMRPISFRKANRRERNNYEKERNRR